MQIELLKKDDIEKKILTRSLYEANFDFGKEKYINYYYDTIIKRNEIVVAKEDDEIVSMCHLNPYVYIICGEIRTIYYLCAIATKEEYRHRGYMSSILTYIDKYLNSIKCPFCIIMAEGKDLRETYKRHGYSDLCNFTYDKFSKCEYDIYPEKNAEFNYLMEKEQIYLEMEDEEYKENLKHQVVLAKITCYDTMPYDMTIDDMKHKKVYVCQEG